MQHKLKKNLRTAFYAIFLFTAIICSIGILFEINHNCTGKDCPICKDISISFFNLKLLFLLIILLKDSKSFAKLQTIKFFYKLKKISLNTSLITQKNRMND